MGHKIFVWGNLVHKSVFLETRVVVIATKGNHRRRRKTLCMFNPLFKTWRKRLQPATHFSRLLGQNYKQATFNTFLHLVGDFLEFPLHANTTAWSKSSCACSKFSFSGTNQCRRVEFFSHQTKNGNLRRRDGYFFLSGLLAGKSTLFVSSVFQFMQTRLTSDSSIDDTCIQHGGMSISFSNTIFFFIFPLSWFV